MAELLLGPLLRYVDASCATVWVETDAPCAVEVAGAKADTFEVDGRHYALVVIEGVDGPTEYDVRIDGDVVWPEPDSPFPPSRITPLTGDTLRLVFGSCRKPDGREWGPDALAAYALRLAEAGEWPDALLLLGDQVYADETSDAMAEWIAQRRDIGEPPGRQVADFQEYAHLYREAWSSPAVRWLLSTVPTSMIFDDHDMHDDWNTSASWRADAARTSWWAERERGGLMAYWIYQHIGNLSPDELAADDTYRAVVTADGDTAPILRAFADSAVEEIEGRKNTRWSYRRDFGPARFLAVDTRCGRVLQEPRGMLSDAEFDWIEANAEGDHRHLLIGSSLPWLMPPVISHLQSMNEVACRRPGLRGRVAEWVRRKADLEHWPAFRRSSDRLARLINRAADSGMTVCVLSGDVHHVYVAEAHFDQPTAARVFQLTCSPMHNAAERFLRPLFVMAWWRPLARVFRWLMLRSPEIEPLPVEWTKLHGPDFGNTIATLRIDGDHVAVDLERARGDSDRPRLEPLPTIRLN
ncbi:alkaline phosphatase D family protein [Actinokineospora fastidiosa]|uniref:Alkaline phosphatase n=1 Tax=Actinokineospora fastidiosa TaxID=1816 RepID=A0A918LDE3_9PSEU|nr:alkaline phosphatase D family protein [Actinokineospora fastidiosa]GGS32111.1 alkaline phosphatase [Actinokineospora fastidiosa]